MKQKLNSLFNESNSREVGDTMRHEFDLIEINQARHREKIAESMKRNIQIEKTEPKVPNALAQKNDEGQSGSIVNKFTHK